MFLPLAITQVRGEHVAVTLFTDRASAFAMRRILVLAHVIEIAGFSLLAYALFVGALRAYNATDAYFGVNQIVTCDLPPDAPSFITRVCGSVFHILRFGFGQARRARSPQIAQVSDALLRVFCCRATSAAASPAPPRRSGVRNPAQARPSQTLRHA